MTRQKNQNTPLSSRVELALGPKSHPVMNSTHVMYHIEFWNRIRYRVPDKLGVPLTRRHEGGALVRSSLPFPSHSGSG